MAFRGRAPANATVTVKLTLDFSCTGSAVLMAGAGAAGGDANAGSVVVAPGGFGSVKVKTPAKGILKAVVDFTDSDDSGRLDVTAPGGFANGAAIQGDPTRWTFSVQKA